MSNVALNNDTCSHGFVRASCTNCNLKGLCLPLAMDVKDIDRLDNIIQRGRPLQSGDHLYRAGDTFTSIYAVRSGSIKTYLIDDDGVEQITGFYLPGEVLGFDGIDNNNYGCNVVALETSTVCEILFTRLEELSLQIPTLQRHFFQLMSRHIESNHQMLLTLSKKNAEGRVSTLLLVFPIATADVDYHQMPCAYLCHAWILATFSDLLLKPLVAHLVAYKKKALLTLMAEKSLSMTMTA
mgnify:CR=1 FL=1